MTAIDSALVAYQEGRPEQAEQICRRVLVESPKSPQASWLLCQILIQRGQAADAEAQAAFALTESVHADLLTIRGEALAMLGRTEEALVSLSASIDRRLFNPRAHEVLSTLLAQQRDPTPRFTVSVVTATVGSACLARAIESVQAQTYPLLEHVVVVDGPEHRACVEAELPQTQRHPVHMLPLPFNVGSGGYCGHRVYGAVPFLVSGRFVAFLDEDNWFEPEHVASLMAKITVEGLAWAYALRNIVDAEGRFIASDDCESLGQWPIWCNPNGHLVDTNCYMLRRDVAIATGHLWHRRFREELNPDILVCQQLLKDHPSCGTTGRGTVNYRVGMTGDSVNASWFLKGNTAMREQYGESFPWRKSATDSRPA